MAHSTNAHIMTWLLAFIFFFAALVLHKKGKRKAEKAVHMLLRIFYIFIIVTGVLLLHFDVRPLEYFIKAVAGLWVISMFEMMILRMKKGKNTKAFWVQLLIAMLLVFYFGYRLPLGY